jgi:hypothetical protein
MAFGSDIVLTKTLNFCYQSTQAALVAACKDAVMFRSNSLRFKSRSSHEVWRLGFAAKYRA